MKGVSYLIDGQGTKTHAVLDLEIWQATLEAVLLEEVSAQTSDQQARRPGFLTELLTQAGYTQKQLDEMNRCSAEEVLEPLTAEELGLNNASPTYSTLIHRCSGPEIIRPYRKVRAAQC